MVHAYRFNLPTPYRMMLFTFYKVNIFSVFFLFVLFCLVFFTIGHYCYIFSFLFLVFQFFFTFYLSVFGHFVALALKSLAFTLGHRLQRMYEISTRFRVFFLIEKCDMILLYSLHIFIKLYCWFMHQIRRCQVISLATRKKKNSYFSMN